MLSRPTLLSSGPETVVLVVVTVWLLLCLALAFTTVSFTLDTMAWMLVKLMPTRLGCATRLVTFRIVLCSMLLVVWKVDRKPVLWFSIASSPLPGTATSELIRRESLLTFPTVIRTWCWFLNGNGPAMIVIASMFTLCVSRVMIGVVLALALLFTLVVTKITLSFPRIL